MSGKSASLIKEAILKRAVKVSPFASLNGTRHQEGKQPSQGRNSEASHFPLLLNSSLAPGYSDNRFT